MAAEASHGRVRSAATVATVVETQIGNDIALPTRPNGWTINQIMAQITRQTATAAELIGGTVRMNLPSGDAPAGVNPSKFPVFESGSFLGATAPVATCPLHKYDINQQVAGKANVQLLATNDIASTVAPIYTAGIHFAPGIVQPVRPKFSDFIRGTISAATRTQVGSIELSENAKEIVGILGYLAQDGVLTTAEELVGFFDLDSDDFDLKPSEWLFNEVSGAGLGALIGGSRVYPPMPHAVSIPVPAGATVDVFVTLTNAVTNPADVIVVLMYI